MYEWMIVYEAMAQVSHKPNILAYSYAIGVGSWGARGGWPPNNQALYYRILYYIKRLIVLI